MQIKAQHWHIFCAVIDNFGDIGICWRLSRQLVNEYELTLRLWVDDLASFQKLCPQVNPNLVEQIIDGVHISLWSAQTNWLQVTIPDVVIEALACTIPKPYQQRMAANSVKPLWLNLEYLSAESWVEGCHTLASPQPDLAINKYFFFPGFTSATGGLLQEQQLASTRDQFIANHKQQQQFWQSLGIDDAQQYQYKISLFAYAHSQLADLLQCWQQHTQPILCVVPEGLLAEQLQTLLPISDLTIITEQHWLLGNLSLKILPFLPQQDYDYLLWACDINFVRGEDSIIRAHWANKPFIWQIYQQQEEAHLIKLQAFLDLYCQHMPEKIIIVMNNLFMAWNNQQPLTNVWQAFMQVLPEIAQFNVKWQQQLSLNGDLARNLMYFVEKEFIIEPKFR